VTPSRCTRQWQAVDQHGQHPTSARHLERDWIGLARTVVCEFEPRAIGRKHDPKLRLGVLAREQAATETLQRRRQFAHSHNERAFEGRRQRHRLADAGERVEQDRRRPNPSPQACHPRPPPTTPPPPPPPAPPQPPPPPL